MTEHRELQQLMGAYVLGGLSAADRHVFESHLETCTSCRDEVARHASLPGLLRSGHAVPAEERGPGQEVLPRLLSSVAQERSWRRRRAMSGGLVAAAAVIAAVLFALRTGDTGEPEQAEPARVVALTSADSAASGEGLLIEKGWGTEVRLSADALPGNGPYRLVVVAPDGTRQLAAAWGATPGGTAKVTGATSFKPVDIAEVRVLAPEGVVLVGSGDADRDD